jgi:hypothetical protein
MEDGGRMASGVLGHRLFSWSAAGAWVGRGGVEGAVLSTQYAGMSTESRRCRAVAWEEQLTSVPSAEYLVRGTAGVRSRKHPSD